MSEYEEDVEDRDEDEYSLDPRVVEAILEAVEDGNAEAVDELMEPLHAADIADLLEQIGSGPRAALVQLWSKGIDYTLFHTPLSSGMRLDGQPET